MKDHMQSAMAWDMLACPSAMHLLVRPGLETRLTRHAAQTMEKRTNAKLVR